MKIGFIGAGKVGFSLGKYLVKHRINVLGYYSLRYHSAKKAADFTGTIAYETLEELTEVCDLIFITVPDDKIKDIWEKVRNLPIEGKMFCHCSGSLPSTILEKASKYGAFSYSLHPLYAISSKEESYKELDKAYFTLEGEEQKMLAMEGLLKQMGNPYQKIKAENKALYHAAAVTVSNQVSALLQQGFSMLEGAGFSKENALEALWPLIIGNITKVHEVGTILSLTGPVERGDYKTLSRHLEVIQPEDRTLYALLSLKLISLAEKKHPEKDYGAIQDRLKQEVKCSF